MNIKNDERLSFYAKEWVTHKEHNKCCALTNLEGILTNQYNLVRDKKPGYSWSRPDLKVTLDDTGITFFFLPVDIPTSVN